MHSASTLPPSATSAAGEIARYHTDGFLVLPQEGVECCYARQTKFWVKDPDETLWEIYLVEEDIDEPGASFPPQADKASAGAGETAPRTHIVWTHYLVQPIPARIEHDENSVDEVVLEGSANLAAAAAQLPALLADAFRVLRPGGEVRIHGLSGDAPLTESLPTLPGPAAMVESVPTHRDFVKYLADAGFIQLHLDILSPKAHFTVGGVGLREILISGHKSGHRNESLAHTAIYLGPLAQVTDDFGHTFRRGEPVPLNVHDSQTLSRSAAAAAFLML
jgi:hypothetical protein